MIEEQRAGGNRVESSNESVAVMAGWGGGREVEKKEERLS